MKKWRKLAPWARARGEKLGTLAERGARIWAAHWVLIVGSFLVFCSVLLKWVEFPLTQNLSGLRLPLLRDVGLIAHVYLLSFGLLAIGVLTMGLVLLRLSGSCLALAAAILITLFVMVPSQITFQQPALLRRLSDEDQNVPLITLFTKNYLPRNLGPAETIPKQLVLYTAWGRFLAACSFLRIGWYCFGFGSVLVAAYSISRLRGERMPTVLALICLPVGALLILATPSAIGQYYLTAASTAKAHGNNQSAIVDYRKAMQWDEWYAQDIDTYSTIGELQKQAGVAEDSPERHIRRAIELKQASQYELAIFEFNKAADGTGALAQAAKRESARTRADLGLALYRAGSIGGAVTNWEQALAEDPSQLYILPYLARGNYEVGRYQAALDVIAHLLKIVVNHPPMLANAYSLGGDSYAKLDRMVEARRYYSLAALADNILNYWALSRLAGQ
jgi:tetratricopeptide (TPR) repeat protein